MSMRQEGGRTETVEKSLKLELTERELANEFQISEWNKNMQKI